MATDRKLTELSQQSALAAEEGRRSLELQSRILGDADAVRTRGRAAVEATVPLKRLRAVKNALVEATAPITAKIEAARVDPDLNEEGRRRALDELGQQVRDAVYAVVDKYNADEKDLLDSFPPIAPGEVPMSDADAKRVVVLLNQVPQLSPREFLAQLQGAVGRMDRVIVQALLPLARSFRTKPEFGEFASRTPLGEDDPLALAINYGEKLLRTAPDGWRLDAHDHAREVAQRLRNQMETVASTIVTEGRWVGTLNARMRDGQGRLGATPDLDPLPGEEEVTRPLGV